MSKRHVHSKNVPPLRPSPPDNGFMKANLSSNLERKPASRDTAMSLISDKSDRKRLREGNNHFTPSLKRLKSDSSDIKDMDVSPREAGSLSTIEDKFASMNPMSALKRAPIRKKTIPIGDSDSPLIIDQKLPYSSYATTNMLTRPRRTSLTATSTNYPSIEFEDFWRDVRSWDFLLELDKLMNNSTSTNPPSKKTNQLHDSIFSSLNPISAAGAKEDDKEDIIDDDVSILNTRPSRQQELQQQQQSPASLPLTFLSARQYKALWAPHCCSESRAQILSDFAGDIGYWRTINKAMTPGRVMNNNHTTSNNKKFHHPNNNNNGKKAQGPVRVKVSTLNRDVGTYTDYITIKVDAADTDTDISFLPNDIVLLTYNLSLISLAAQGKLMDTEDGKDHFTIQCIVGHTEFSRRTIDGLQVKVSRKRWLQYSSSFSSSSSYNRNSIPPTNTGIMFLIKLGANITALREFTALSRVDTMPLLPFLLNIQPTHIVLNNGNHRHPKELLASMGGKEALGKGFVAYLERKYNSSQIAAISAAAREYGDGGFTLIKVRVLLLFFCTIK